MKPVEEQLTNITNILSSLLRTKHKFIQGEVRGKVEIHENIKIQLFCIVKGHPLIYFYSLTYPWTKFALKPCLGGFSSFNSTTSCNFVLNGEGVRTSNDTASKMGLRSERQNTNHLVKIPLSKTWSKIDPLKTIRMIKIEKCITYGLKALKTNITRPNLTPNHPLSPFLNHLTLSSYPSVRYLIPLHFRGTPTGLRAWDAIGKKMP